MNTSATGGYLRPSGGSVLSDDALEDVIQAHVVGITGLDGSLVRPRWQRIAPKMPEPTQTWIAVGSLSKVTDDGPAFLQSDESQTYIRHQVINVLATAYGPESEGVLELLRDGLYIPQNNQPLAEYDIKFASADAEIRSVPELVNQQWIRRYDFTYRLRRRIVREYQILPIDQEPDISLEE